MNMGLVLDDVKVTGGHHYRHFVLWRALAAPGIFIWGTVARRSGERKSASGVQGRSPSRKFERLRPRKLKQFADIVYRF